MSFGIFKLLFRFALVILLIKILLFCRASVRFQSELGSGAGKVFGQDFISLLFLKISETIFKIQGGGAGGSVREAGGAFGKMEAAREEQFFRNKQKDQLEKMKVSLDAQKSEIEKQIKEHELELARLKKEIEAKKK